MTLSLYQNWKSAVEVTRKPSRMFHPPYTSLDHMPTLWPRRMRYLGLIYTNHDSAPGCTHSHLAKTYNQSAREKLGMVVGSMTLISDTFVKWKYPGCLLCAKGLCWVLRQINERDRPSPSSLTAYHLQNHFHLYYAFCDSKCLDHF